MIDPSRIRTLKAGAFGGKVVLYWMIRDKRVSDNWSLLVAQQIAIKNKVPLIVCFQFIGNFPDSNIRQNGFLFCAQLYSDNKNKDRVNSLRMFFCNIFLIYKTIKNSERLKSFVNNI